MFFKETKRLIQVDINKSLIAKGIKQGSCNLKIGFPKDMPKEEIEDIKNRLNGIIDDIRKYL